MPSARVARLLDRVIGGGLVYHVGPPMVNRLGYQVFRALYKNAGWHLRSEPVAPDLGEHVAALERDGCIRIPDFLSADVFAKVREEYERSQELVPYENLVTEDNNVVEETIDLKRHIDRFPTARAQVVDNPKIRAIVAGALRRPIHVRPNAWMKRWLRPAERRDAKGHGHVIGANYLHADVHFPTFKAWLYMSDIDESNGAFVFAPGSHRMTLARLAYEYEASLRVAKSREDGTATRVPYALIRTPNARQSESMKLSCQSMVGKANTLVIANTQGFHRQGEFALNARREAIVLCYRSAEPGAPAS